VCFGSKSFQNKLQSLLGVNWRCITAMKLILDIYRIKALLIFACYFLLDYMFSYKEYYLVRPEDLQLLLVPEYIYYRLEKPCYDLVSSEIRLLASSAAEIAFFF
jgi:hypothetical protein